MNNSELNELLQRSRVPERKPEEWQEFANDTMRAVRSPVSAHAVSGEVLRSRPGFKSIALWAFGCATACILAGFIFGQWHGQRERSRDEIADARKLFLELNAMFPNQIEAVVLDERGARLMLAERAVPRNGAPIFVRICTPRECERVVTFSGQHVRINGQSCEVLLDARGNVIVAGEHFAWSSGERATRTDAIQIEAVQLSAL